MGSQVKDFTCAIDIHGFNEYKIVCLSVRGEGAMWKVAVLQVVP